MAYCVCRSRREEVALTAPDERARLKTRQRRGGYGFAAAFGVYAAGMIAVFLPHHTRDLHCEDRIASFSGDVPARLFLIMLLVTPLLLVIASVLAAFGKTRSFAFGGFIGTTLGLLATAVIFISPLSMC
jgi:hypothetical protein